MECQEKYKTGVFSTCTYTQTIMYQEVLLVFSLIVIFCRGELPGLGPLTINLNINVKTNGIDVNNILT